MESHLFQVRQALRQNEQLETAAHDVQRRHSAALNCPESPDCWR